MARRSPGENANGTRRHTRRGRTVSGLVRAEVTTLHDRVARQLRQQRDELIHEQKDRAARELAAIGQAVRAAAERLHKSHALVPYATATAAADAIEGLARTIRRRDAIELAEDLGRAARQRPGAVIGAAYLAGVAIGRFMKAGLAAPERQKQE